MRSILVHMAALQYHGPASGSSVTRAICLMKVPNFLKLPKFTKRLSALVINLNLLHLSVARRGG